MPPEMMQLLENPYLLIPILPVGVFVGMTIERSLSDIDGRHGEKEIVGAGSGSATVTVRAGHGRLSRTSRFRTNRMLPISCGLLWQLTSRFNRSSIGAKRAYFGSSIAS